MKVHRFRVFRHRFGVWVAQPTCGRRSCWERKSYLSAEPTVARAWAFKHAGGVCG